jgi:leucyl-tRNA synthetase
MSEKIDMVIQVNGKKRSIINCKKEISEDSLIKLIKDDKKLDKFIKNKKIVRSIFIKNKLINLIVKE